MGIGCNNEICTKFTILNNLQLIILRNIFSFLWPIILKFSHQPLLEFDPNAGVRLLNNIPEVFVMEGLEMEGNREVKHGQQGNARREVQQCDHCLA